MSAQQTKYVVVYTVLCLLKNRRENVDNRMGTKYMYSRSSWDTIV